MLGAHYAVAIKRCICAVPFALLLAAFLVSCSPLAGAFDYARPYLAMLLVGSTLFAARSRRFAILDNKPLGYLATISFALYMIHPLLSHSWLGSGDLLEKYLKRPLLLLVLFVLAHLSTFHFERHAIRLGKRLCGHLCGGGKPAVHP
jgi:peptidoglycan/LPS O-acetylase OafA/YrhL